ncbi:MAG: transglycosylase SLT domain-containing protein, partial [Paludibacteraceae bacterium]|nr:transglycosylase SLT domain-containing protein [Paludibacteraceae bacterium]
RTHAPQRHISPYDSLFRRYAREIQWDWRLLAAVCYQESRFKTDLTSPFGARGLMQLVPTTAERFGLTEDNIEDPAANISAGVQLIKHLKMVFREIEDSEEQIPFVLASYNAGPAHILDAMHLARACGQHPHHWFECVEAYLLRLNDSRYNRDSACKYGSFNGRQTAAYVRRVLMSYEQFCLQTEP